MVKREVSVPAARARGQRHGELAPVERVRAGGVDASTEIDMRWNRLAASARGDQVLDRGVGQLGLPAAAGGRRGGQGQQLFTGECAEGGRSAAGSQHIANHGQGRALKIPHRHGRTGEHGFDAGGQDRTRVLERTGQTGQGPHLAQPAAAILRIGGVRSPTRLGDLRSHPQQPRPVLLVVHIGGHPTPSEGAKPRAGSEARPRADHRCE